MFNKKPEPLPMNMHADSNASPLGPRRTAEVRPLNSAPAQPRAESSATRSPSIISEGFEFVGDMKSGGSLSVDGTIRGNLVVETLRIGVTGAVDGSVRADSIDAQGSLSGTVECKDLTIGDRAMVDGKVTYSTITIQRGATIKGELRRA